MTKEEAEAPDITALFLRDVEAELRRARVIGS